MACGEPLGSYQLGLKVGLAPGAVWAGIYSRTSILGNSLNLHSGYIKRHSSQSCGPNPKIFGSLNVLMSGTVWRFLKIFWLHFKILTFGPMKLKPRFPNIAWANKILTNFSC